MANKVEIVFTCSVKTASSTTANGQSYGLSRADLTPWDLQLLFFDPIQKGVFFYKPEPPTQRREFENTFINHLKESLSRALDYFPPLAGRLATTKNDDDTTNIFVDCNNAGASFTHAVASGVHVRDILEPVYVPFIVGSFFPTDLAFNIEGVSKPLLTVQVTELVDGIFVGCTMNHCVADGTCFWHFFNSWSEISRGSSKISKFPDFDRPDILPKVFPVRLPPLDMNPQEKFAPPPLLERVFHFSKENLAKLKSRANLEAGRDNISTLQALIAHIWRAVMRYRGLDPQEENRCMVIIGGRARLPLPDAYFGNAIHFTFVTTTNGNLVGNGLGWAATEVNKVVGSQTREEVLRVFEDYGKNFKILKKEGAMAKNNKIIVTSSPRHNVYGVDFGWGRPVAVRSGKAQKLDGKITVYPAPEAGGIDVEACLSPETLVAIGDDAEFMEAVTL